MLLLLNLVIFLGRVQFPVRWLPVCSGFIFCGLSVFCAITDSTRFSPESVCFSAMEDKNARNGEFFKSSGSREQSSCHGFSVAGEEGF
jgi:hypothetical protein